MAPVWRHSIMGVRHPLFQMGVRAAGGLPAPLVFSDDFARSDGAVGNDWSGDTFAIVSGKVINTPNLGAELLTDGALENWTTATNLTSWGEAAGGTTTINRETSVVQGGSSALRIAVDGSGSLSNVNQTLGAGNHKWVLADLWMRSPNTSQGGYVYISGSMDSPRFSPGTTYGNQKASLRTTASAKSFRMSNQGVASDNVYFDTVSVKQQTDTELQLTRPAYPTADYVLEVAVSTLERGTKAGIIFALDNPANPQNYCLLVVDGATVFLWKFLSGVLSLVASKTEAHVAGQTLKIVKWGTRIKAYHNDVAIAAEQAVSDAAIKDNLYAGIFSTYSGNTFDNWTETVKATGGSDSFLAPFFSGADGYIFPIGDSVTVGATDEVTGVGYPVILTDAIATQTKAYWTEKPARYAGGGWTVATVKAGIDTALAARADTPTHVLIYLGANDVVSMPVEATYKTNMNYILDAVHAKWANAQIYVGTGGRTGSEANTATLMTWNADCLAGRAYAHAGINYIDVFSGNEATLLADSVHPNHAGFVVMAAAWQATL
ncbi:MAG: SGNH/GDSL hydrolase family protein [Hyphomicrobiaceae bacterium]|nr:MAG: SGNH/GDSL hydrolase family protein [Hyphomicrobiaceae bacterium]